jgi:uncharacterized membrane protein (UPF0127 family)
VLFRCLGLALLLCLVAPLAGAQAVLRPEDGQPQVLPASPLTIATRAGVRHRLMVEVAATPAQQAIGMMWRTRVAPDSGMLFPFRQPRVAQFWMENTLVPLDLLFVRADGRISSIIANAVPLSRSLLQSREPVVAVLELAGGRAAQLSIKAGDRVIHPALEATARKALPQ